MGIPWTTSLDFRRPLCGFSIKYGTLKCLARSSAFCTSLSEPSKSRGVFAFARATEYIVHNGEAQIASGFPCFSIISGVTSKILQQIVGSIFESKSKLVHVQPCFLNTFEIDLVPQNSSSKCAIYIALGNRGGDECSTRQEYFRYCYK